MVSKGFKISEGEFTLEVTNVENVTNNVQCVEYIVKRGNTELTDGFVYIMKNQDHTAILKKVLTKIINAVKRVSRRTS